MSIIEVENISKQYTIGKKESYGSLRDEIMQAIAAPFKRLGGRGRANGEENTVWALKDVSFKVEEGDVLGIIGKNGAGKSTLLKILSRITEPTTGRISMKGRVASLLEVGTGFHPELTGRENIFLNGALLGMANAEIRRKFDEIVAFSEIEKFLDTPVKRYSSGMYVRLAFAVAAHLEPEILIVDEVLAVGDATFQKKCLGKMGDVAKGGRTVLFVSHNMAAVENLCNRGVILEKGKTSFAGDASDSVKYYLSSMLEHAEKADLESKRASKKGVLAIKDIDISDEHATKNNIFPVGSKLRISIVYEAEKAINNPRIIIGIYNIMQEGITRFDTNIAKGLPGSLPKHGKVLCVTDELNLTPGRYVINIAFFCNNSLEDYIPQAKCFDIAATDFFESGKSLAPADERLTKVLVRHNWELHGYD